MAWMVGWAQPRSAGRPRGVLDGRVTPRGRRALRRWWWVALAALVAAIAPCWASAQCPSGACPVAQAAPKRDSASDQEPAMAMPSSAVVRIMVVGGPVRSFGSGTVVRWEPANSAVLTCAHLFREGAQQVWVFAGGTPWKAHLLAANPTWDLAVLEVPGWLELPADPSDVATARGAARCPVEPAAIANTPPVPGQWLQSCGFGSDGRYRCSRGQVLGYARTGNTQGYETLALTGAVRLGDSGGPIFDAQGQLVAVVWGTDGRTVVGTYCGRIRSFLAEVFGSRRPRPGIPPPPGIPQRPTPGLPAPGMSAPPGVLPPGGEKAPGAVPLPRTEPAPSTQEPPQGSSPGHGPQQGSVKTAPAVPLPSNPPPGRPRRSEPAPRAVGLSPESLDQALRLLAGLRDRLERIETQMGPDNLRALLRDAASGVARGSGLDGAHGPGLIENLLPAILVALGWTGPPALAAVVTVRILADLVRRRRARKAGGQRPSLAGPSGALNDEYAAQLAQVFALSGRSVLADATLGREYDQELRQAEQSSDAALAAWAKALRERVARRFFRIHGQSPAPAEPQG